MKTLLSSLTVQLFPSIKKIYILSILLFLPWSGWSFENDIFVDLEKEKEPKKENVKMNPSLALKKKRTLVVNKKFPLIHVEKKYVFKTDAYSEESLALRTRKM